MEYVISIDLGATNVRVGLVGDDLNIVAVNRERSTKNDKDALVAQICRMIDMLPYKEYNVKKVGMSACGMIDHDNIVILPNLGIQQLDLAAVIKKKYGFRMEIKNDANCTCLAEAKYGCTKDVRDSYFITISSGIGGGLVYNHELIDLPFEIGHAFIPYGKGVEEFEKVCSGNGIVKLCSDNYLIVEHAGQFFDMVRKGNPLAVSLFNKWVDMVALQVANIQMSFNTDKICFSGGVMKSADLFVNKVETQANNYIARFPLKPIRIVLAQFDQDAGLMGGVAVALSMKD